MDRHRIVQLTITIGIGFSTFLVIVEPAFAGHAGILAFITNLIWIWEQ